MDFKQWKFNFRQIEVATEQKLIMLVFLIEIKLISLYNDRIFAVFDKDWRDAWHDEAAGDEHILYFSLRALSGRWEVNLEISSQKLEIKVFIIRNLKSDKCILLLECVDYSRLWIRLIFYASFIKKICSSKIIV